MARMQEAPSSVPNDPLQLQILLRETLQELTQEAALRATAESTIELLEQQLRNRDQELQLLRLQLAKLKRLQFGRSSEKLDQQIHQLELRLEELESDQKIEAQVIQPAATPVRKPVRKPLPEHLPRDTISHTSPCRCPDCGGGLKLIGMDVSEVLEYVPARFKVIRHEREKLACGACETIVQVVLPSRPIERGMAGPGLLAHVLVSKYGDHLPLYRQSEIYGREGIELERSTLAGWVGQCSQLLAPLADALGRHVLAGRKLHADDTPIPVLQPGLGKTKAGRLWTYVRDDRSAGQDTPPAVWFQYSPDRKGIRPGEHLKSFSGVLQADGYAGFHHLYRAGKIQEAACWAHVRRKFYDIAEADQSPIAKEAMERIGSLYGIEQEIRGKQPDERKGVRQARAGPLLEVFKQWLNNQLSQLSQKSTLAEAIRYTLPRWPALTRYVDDGLIDIDNNAAERALRTVALGRKNYLFAGSDSGGERAALIYSLLGTAKLNNINPQVYLSRVLERIADLPINRIDELLPWNIDLTEQHPS